MKRSSLAIKPGNIPVGVVGLGLMGTSVATCLLAAGHPVTAVEIDANKRRSARRRILNHLRQMKKEGLLRADPSRVIGRLTVSQAYSALQSSHLVVECVFEDLDVKKDVLRKVEEVISPRSIIGTNTSGIPVTVLQQKTRHPERIVGIHWAEPAHITRF
ncbi:MAG: 3-hydroxyacyl-CoA dehydrogenase family protein, partial [Terracidiphilus sp.]